jgi:hypothetical protein
MAAKLFSVLFLLFVLVSALWVAAERYTNSSRCGRVQSAGQHAGLECTTTNTDGTP